MSKIGQDIAKAVDILAAGGVVAIPTDTVYGLAAKAFHTEAVKKVYTLKKRPYFNPLILHIRSYNDLDLYATNIPPNARSLVETYWPGPLTVVLEKKKIIPDIVTAKLSTVGIRCARHQLMEQLMTAIDFPLAAPSANPFGYISPTHPTHVQDQLGEVIPYILDGGQCAVGIESTIVRFQNNHPTICRSGGLSKEDIEQTIGLSIESRTNTPSIPGNMTAHYAPTKRIIVGNIDNLIAMHDPTKIGILRFQNSRDKNTLAKHTAVLSPKGDINEAAHNLFTALRWLDKTDIEIIIAEKVANHGIGIAINDRLERAATAHTTV